MRPPPLPHDDDFLEFQVFVDEDFPEVTPPSPPAFKPKPIRTPTIKERLSPLIKRLESSTPGAPDVSPSNPKKAASQAFRPKLRPTMAILEILDDGSNQGELIRLRRDTTTVGRNSGDVQIPHDDQISGQHFEIRRLQENGLHRWEIRDLQSTNGTFFHVSRVTLRNRSQFQIGHARFHLEADGHQAHLALINSENDLRTWSLDTNSEFAIGSSSGCNIHLADDPSISSVHARLHRDMKGVWQLSECPQTDGIWVRCSRVTVASFCAFQAGEQRFVLRIQK